MQQSRQRIDKIDGYADVLEVCDLSSASIVVEKIIIPFL
jgi:hypothetical protein